jgi:hypothetical protein
VILTHPRTILLESGHLFFFDNRNSLMHQIAWRLE